MKNRSWDIIIGRFALGCNLQPKDFGLGVLLHIGNPEYSDYGYVSFRVGLVEVYMDWDGNE